MITSQIAVTTKKAPRNRYRAGRDSDRVQAEPRPLAAAMLTPANTTIIAGWPRPGTKVPATKLAPAI